MSLAWAIGQKFPLRLAHSTQNQGIGTLFSGEIVVPPPPPVGRGSLYPGKRGVALK